MRRRLIAALAGLAIGTLVLYAGPRSYMISDLVRDQEERSLERTADLLEEVLDYRLTAGLRIDPDTTEFLVGPDEEVHFARPDGTDFVVGTVNGSTALSTQRTLDDGTRVTVRLAGDSVDQRVADALLPVVVIGSVVTALAVGIAIVLARRLSAPFTALAAHADQLGVGDGVDSPRSGLAEADRLADALDRGRVRIAELLRTEREFSSNASHQLRTPLSALRLRIEDLSMWPETGPDLRDELEASLAEIDRLADTVTDLLELARSGGIGGWTEIPLDDVVRAAIGRWEQSYAAAGRRLAASPASDHAVVATSERAVHLVLDVLFENALSHGAGIVDVSIQDLDSHVALRVADEGRMDASMDPHDAFGRTIRSSSSSGSGIGLSLARTIAESAGARLQVVSRDPTVFELTLPTHRRLLPER